MNSFADADSVTDVSQRLSTATARDRDADVPTHGVSRQQNHLPLILSNLLSSPRVILVAREGKLLGLVTVKDVLRHEAAQEHFHAQSRQRQGHSHNLSEGSVDWRDRVFSEDNAAGLEIILEAVLNGVKRSAARVGAGLEDIAIRLNLPLPRSRSPQRPMPPENRGMAGEEFELGEAES